MSDFNDDFDAEAMADLVDQERKALRECATVPQTRTLTTSGPPIDVPADLPADLCDLAVLYAESCSAAATCQTSDPRWVAFSDRMMRAGQRLLDAGFVVGYGFGRYRVDVIA